MKATHPTAMQFDLVAALSANRSKNNGPYFSLCGLCGLERSRANGSVGVRKGSYELE